MDPSRWQTVNRIFHAALELPVGEREAFVLMEAHDDPDVLSEVGRLLEADGACSGYLEESLIHEPELELRLIAAFTLRPGVILSGRFAILRMVGEGGMGQVYEAEDRELGGSVAVKVIRPEIALHPIALARFRQEVRLAHRISHTNICRIFDLNRDVVLDGGGNPSELYFLTMEFLDGETLAARLQRSGAMPAGEAIAIARQVAAGLDAAHALGIIHRDVKPANIHLVPGTRGSQTLTRVVITDFGLARLDPLQMESELSSSTSLSRPVGTLGYMAPEQLKNTPVSAATDIYAFGLVLFEMITGVRAFPSSNLLSGIAERLSGKIPSIQAIYAEVPAEWEVAIQVCLRLDPAERFSGAADAIEVLEGSRSYLPALRSAPKVERSSLQSHWLAVSASACVLLSLLAGGYRYYQSKADSTVSGGALVYLAPVRNKTGDRSLDNLAVLIKAGLSQSPHINLLDPSRVGDILQQMTKAPDTPIDAAVAREIAMRSGAVRVVFPTVSESGGDYHLDVDIQQPDNTPTRYRNHWVRSFGWHAPHSASGTISPELLSTIRNSSDWIRHEVGESVNDIARLDVPPEDVTTSSWDALSDYIRAEDLQSRQDTNRAVIALQHAVALDPDFATAYGRLGDLLVATGRYRDGYHAYQQALALNQERRLTRKERDRIEGEYAFDSFDFATAEAAYRDYAEYYESDYRAWNFRGYPLLLLGRTEESMATLQKAYSLDPSRGNAPWELGRASIAGGDLSQALHWASVLRAQGDLGTSSYLVGVVEFLEQHYKAALNSFAAIQRARRIEDHSWSYTLQARVEAELGNDAAASQALAEGMAFDRRNGFDARLADKLLAESYLNLRAASYDNCIQNMRAALTLDASPERITIASTVLGIAHRQAPGFKKPAILVQLAKLENMLPNGAPEVIVTVAKLRVHGELLLAENDWKAALVNIRKAVLLEAPTAGQEYLGRALEVAAQHEPDKKRRDAMLHAALNAYGMSALRPNLMWIQPIQPLPGFYRDELVAYCNLAAKQHLSDENTKSAFQSLHHLEEDISSGNPTVSFAKERGDHAE